LIIPLLLLLLAASPGFQRVDTEREDLPAVSAQAWIVYDETSDRVLASHEPDSARPMASTTKMMTALLVAEHADPLEVVEISPAAEAMNHKQVFLEAGDRWLVQDLLEATLVVSANDAAVALAEHVGGSVEAFVAMMNQRADELGLTGTSFRNPHGLDEPGHTASARDLVRLAQALMGYEGLARIVRRTKVMLPDGLGWKPWDTTNELLAPGSGIVGVKTGRTTPAGHVLVTAAERNGRRIYVAVMGSKDAFVDAERLLEYGFATLAPRHLRLGPLMEIAMHGRPLPAVVEQGPWQYKLIRATSQVAWR
jgi:D-alanyl-D-alanine carboxypeptidase